MPTSGRPPPIPPKPRERREGLPDPWVSEIEGYTPLKLLGEGGAGRVYACRDERLGRTVAIKVLNAQASKDPDKVARFLHEARAMARISSPHVVGIYQVGEHARGPFLVMEYLNGEDLESRLSRHVKLSPKEALDLGIQAARGLKAAAAVGIIHRDVKPANIIVVDGQVKLTDFGLAKALDDAGRQTAAGTFVGTAAFIAPERAMGEAGDLRADIYALGATLYCLIEGRPPFVRNTPMNVIAAHISDPPPPLESAPKPVWKVLERTLAKEPGDRFQTYDELIEALSLVHSSVAREPDVSLTGATRRHVRPEEVAPAAADDGEVFETSDAFKAPAQPTGVMGTLKQMSVIEIVQTLEIGRKNAVVDLDPMSADKGTLAFSNGQLTFASYGKLAGPEAFFALTERKDGFFRIHYERMHPDINVDVPNAFLLLEAVRRADESRAGMDPGASDPSMEDFASGPSGIRPAMDAPTSPVLSAPSVHPGFDEDTIQAGRELPDNSIPTDIPGEDAVRVMRLPPDLMPKVTGARAARAIGASNKPASPATKSAPTPRAPAARPPPPAAPESDFVDQTLAMPTLPSSDEATSPRNMLPTSDPTAETERTEERGADRRSASPSASDASGDSFVSDRTLVLDALDQDTDIDGGGIRPPMSAPARPAASMAAGDEDTLQIPERKRRGTSDDLLFDPDVFDEPSLAHQARTLILNLEEQIQDTVPLPKATKKLPTGALLGTGVFLLVALLALFGWLTTRVLGGGDPASEGALNAALARGDNATVIDVVTRIPPLSRTGPQELAFAHALKREGRATEAQRAFQVAGERGAGAGDKEAIAFLIESISSSSPGPAFDALVVWPGNGVTAALITALESDGWWRRQNAYAVLKDRGELESADVEGFAIRGLDEGPTCLDRKKALALLETTGGSERARDAVQRARRSLAKNACMERELLRMMPELGAR